MLMDKNDTLLDMSIFKLEVDDKKMSDVFFFY